jgi:polysaccharide chain length determinant protein (PEP-CTERM system associated)
VLRGRWFLLVPFALGLAATPFIARVVPERYRSETLIMVVPQRVPDSYVRSTVTETVADRLPSISEQILSRSRLERIINDLDLYKHERTREVMEDIVRRMRTQHVTVDLDSKSMDSFRVSYVSNDPATARKVTERLASLYIEQNLRDRESQADSTSQFLEAQLEDAKQRLVQHEKKLEEYRRRHAGQLPTQLQANLQGMQNAQLQLQSISESMNRARERRLLIERQLADAEAFPALGLPAAVGGTPESAAPGTTAQQLEAAQARLEAYKQRYTADHPDVLNLQRTITELQHRLEAETPLASSEANREPSLSPAEMVQQKRIRDLQAELAVIDHQLRANEAEEKRLKQAIKDYQAKVDVLPTRESELVELTRDYSTLQTAYSNLLMKREDSKIAANLERRQIGEQFRILDPASLPEAPFNQRQRMLMMGSGAFGGLALGLLLIGFGEFRDSSFRREEEVARLLSVPVLALVPVMISEADRRAKRRRAVLVDAVGVVVVIGATALLAFWRFRS